MGGKENHKFATLLATGGTRVVRGPNGHSFEETWYGACCQESRWSRESTRVVHRVTRDAVDVAAHPWPTAERLHERHGFQSAGLPWYALLDGGAHRAGGVGSWTAELVPRLPLGQVSRC